MKSSPCACLQVPPFRQGFTCSQAETLQSAPYQLGLQLQRSGRASLYIRLCKPLESSYFIHTVCEKPQHRGLSIHRLHQQFTNKYHGMACMRTDYHKFPTSLW